MLAPQRTRWRGCRVGIAIALTGLCLFKGQDERLSADEVTLKNGMTYEGTAFAIQDLTRALVQQKQGPIKIVPITVIDTGIKRIYVPSRQVLEVNKGADLSRFDTFPLRQQKRGGRKMVQSVGGFKATPFDEFGRRTVTVSGNREIVQGVTEIHPRHLTVVGITQLWKFGIATTSVPVPILDRMIRQTIERTNPNDRLSIARFYLQAGMYPQADAELASIAKDFPEFKERVEEVSLELRQLVARRLLAELSRRRSAGQHRLAYGAAKRFPVKNMSAAVLREVRELIAEYELAAEQIEKTVALLGELPSQLSDRKQIAKLALLRSIVVKQLAADYESFERLAAFVQQSDDKTRTPAEKLALAYSGWVLGAANAIDNLDTTLGLWNARSQILEFLRTENPLQRKQLLAKLLEIEGVGPISIGQMIPRLPMPVETPHIRPGHAHRIEVTGDTVEVPVAYSALLPAEYPTTCTPQHQYPMIVALRPRERTTNAELSWWGGTPKKPGQASRHGYIVIAPEYVKEEQDHYDYGAAAHYVVLQAIRDARKRFNIDSDRIFLTGHGMGGDAAFDIGMSHPDLFAGVMPITGIIDKYCKWYWHNAKHTAWYVVGGERDRDTVIRNSRELSRMLRSHYDIIYAEYTGRGYESYYAEIHKLFDWMDLHRRVKHLREFEYKLLRPGDNRFQWIKAEGLPRNVLESDVLGEAVKKRVNPMKLTARVTVGNTIFLTSGADKNTLWLSPEFIDFDRRVAIRHRGRQRFNNFLKPDVEVLLEDLRIRGDRQKLFWSKVVID